MSCPCWYSRHLAVRCTHEWWGRAKILKGFNNSTRGMWFSCCGNRILEKGHLDAQPPVYRRSMVPETAMATGRRSLAPPLASSSRRCAAAHSHHPPSMLCCCCTSAVAAPFAGRITSKKNDIHGFGGEECYQSYPKRTLISILAVAGVPVRVCIFHCSHFQHSAKRGRGCPVYILKQEELGPDAPAKNI